jgi:hypothetical protein
VIVAVIQDKAIVLAVSSSQTATDHLNKKASRSWSAGPG